MISEPRHALTLENLDNGFVVIAYAHHSPRAERDNGRFVLYAADGHQPDWSMRRCLTPEDLVALINEHLQRTQTTIAAAEVDVLDLDTMPSNGTVPVLENVTMS